MDTLKGRIQGMTIARRKALNEPRLGAETGGRRERRTAETRVALFRAAMELFVRHGFNNVTVGDITNAVDVGKGTFFNYFPTKDHVLGVMAEIQLEKVSEAMLIVRDPAVSVHTILRRLALRLSEEPGRSPEQARTIVSAFLASNVVREILQVQMERGRKMIAELVARGQERGEIAASLRKGTGALQFQQTVMGTILLWSLHGTPSLAKRIEDSFEYFWRSIEVRHQELGRRRCVSMD